MAIENESTVIEFESVEQQRRLRCKEDRKIQKQQGRLITNQIKSDPCLNLPV